MYGGTARWYWIVLLIVCGLVALYAERRNLAGKYAQWQASEDTVQAHRQRLEKLVKERDRLREKVVDLNNDPVELEAAIRRSKKLVREGETIYRIEPGTADSAERGSPTALERSGRH
jgi:cell division protein FtsB